jgi:hypothetical protein
MKAGSFLNQSDNTSTFLHLLLVRRHYLRDCFSRTILLMLYITVPGNLNSCIAAMYIAGLWPDEPEQQSKGYMAPRPYVLVYNLAFPSRALSSA